MSIISGAAGAVDYAQQYLELTNRVLAEGNISAETITAQAEAEVLAEAQVAVLDQALDIERAQSSRLIDLLA